jgi:hypothetical protein
MKRKTLIATASGMALLLIWLIPASGTPDQMEYTDPEGDLLVLGDPTGHEDDIDIVSVTVDQSSFPSVVVTITVKGIITANYEGEDENNYYGFGLDLDGDEAKAEVSVQVTGGDEGKDSFVTIADLTSLRPLNAGEYAISGSTFTVYVPATYCLNYTEVVDFTAKASNSFPDSNIIDAVNDLFGEDGLPYGHEDADDDDDTEPTDDDDDTEPDDDDDDDDSTPGFPLSLILLSVIGAGILVTRIRKKS